MLCQLESKCTSIDLQVAGTSYHTTVVFWRHLFLFVCLPHMKGSRQDLILDCFWIIRRYHTVVLWTKGCLCWKTNKGANQLTVVHIWDDPFSVSILLCPGYVSRRVPYNLSNQNFYNISSTSNNNSVVAHVKGYVSLAIAIQVNHFPTCDKFLIPWLWMDKG